MTSNEYIYEPGDRVLAEYAAVWETATYIGTSVNGRLVVEFRDPIGLVRRHHDEVQPAPTYMVTIEITEEARQQIEANGKNPAGGNNERQRAIQTFLEAVGSIVPSAQEAGQ